MKEDGGSTDYEKGNLKEQTKTQLKNLCALLSN